MLLEPNGIKNNRFNLFRKQENSLHTSHSFDPKKKRLFHGILNEIFEEKLTHRTDSASILWFHTFSFPLNKSKLRFFLGAAQCEYNHIERFSKTPILPLRTLLNLMETYISHISSLLLMAKSVDIHSVVNDAVTFPM